MRTINRREFVTTAAAVGASGVLRAPAFAYHNQSALQANPVSAKPAGYEAVAGR